MIAQKPSYYCVGKIFINNKTRNKMLVILKTPPCSKLIKDGRCLTCGFDNHSKNTESCNLVSQLNYLKKIIYLEKVEHLELLTPGSILDEKQIPYKDVLKLIKNIAKIKLIKSIHIEGRVEYCDIRKINEIKTILGEIELEYGIGLESYSDYVRNTLLKKDLKLQDYIDCLKKLQKSGVRIITYVLIGIPGLKLNETFEDATRSIIEVTRIYKRYNCKGRINLYPIFIAPNTILKRLYQDKKYKLMKIKEIMRIIQKISHKIDLKKCPIFIGLDDEGISEGLYVGHNENKELWEAIEKFNATQDINIFDKINNL